MPDDWERLKPTIIQYYHEGTCKEMRKRMKREHGFEKSIRSYRAHLKSWDVRKYRKHPKLGVRAASPSYEHDFKPQSPDGLSQHSRLAELPSSLYDGRHEGVSHVSGHGRGYYEDSMDRTMPSYHHSPNDYYRVETPSTANQSWYAGGGSSSTASTAAWPPSPQRAEHYQLPRTLPGPVEGLHPTSGIVLPPGPPHSSLIQTAPQFPYLPSPSFTSGSRVNADYTPNY